jgi:hypothetical protein
MTTTQQTKDGHPVYIGTTKAGVEWWAYRSEDVAPMRRAFAELKKN